jgi:hypothetical protein
MIKDDSGKLFYKLVHKKNPKYNICAINKSKFHPRKNKSKFDQHEKLKLINRLSCRQVLYDARRRITRHRWSSRATMLVVLRCTAGGGDADVVDPVIGLSCW